MRFLSGLKISLFLACLLPLARLLWLGFNDGLGANPIEFITRSTGTWTLSFLLITLAITPLRRLSGWQWPIRVRRMLGLFAFFYACLHFTTYVWLDQFFDPTSIYQDIFKRPFITIGFASFLLLIPLAATSTQAMMRRLGGRNWQRLHRLVYLIAMGGVVHYWWLVKKDVTQPAIYAAVLAVLLGYRLWRKRSGPAFLNGASTQSTSRPAQENQR
ncbi:MAG: protein-methionine-sulfoxide reductase heme-binding subunit MsrQ [Sulfurimicrobium sp.]|nr:protein-methionine-sulfoxide reductase heme-binding subunit MsrQ [Sulfurimicrobium sp.]